MIDSHAHVTFSSYDDDRQDVIFRARAAGLSGWIEIGTTVAESKAAVELARSEDGVFATVGVHPSDIGELNEEAWQELEQLLQDEAVKAVGEVGLDFYRGGDLQQQLDVLRRFITLAQERQLPAVFHVRSGEDNDAHDELIKLLQSYDTPPAGVIHTYSGTVRQAEEYLKLGMHLSFSGVITFKNAGEIVEVAKTMPMEKMLIETDCPFLTPEPHRGQRNEPAYVEFVADKIAHLRNMTLQEVKDATEANTRRLFKLPALKPT